jgi:hypothetical protein
MLPRSPSDAPLFLCSEKYMVTIPMYTATIVAFLLALSLAITYLPSVTTTILRLRNGHIATLRNKDFNRYRCAPDQVALLTPTLFWGSLFSSIVVGGAIGLIVFFFVSLVDTNPGKILPLYAVVPLMTIPHPTSVNNSWLVSHRHRFLIFSFQIMLEILPILAQISN